MKTKPKCAIENCNRTALILFGDNWICGECLSEYDRRMKEKQFLNLQEELKMGADEECQ